jgi:hypothetical protein
VDRLGGDRLGGDGLGGGTLLIEPLPRAGLYTLDRAEGMAGVFPVNLFDERETRAAVSEDLMVSGQPASGVSSLDGEREIWEWFVFAALVLLAGEWMLYAWRSRLS